MVAEKAQAERDEFRAKLAAAEASAQAWHDQGERESEERDAALARVRELENALEGDGWRTWNEIEARLKARVTALEKALRELLPFVTNRGRMDCREAAFDRARRVLEGK